MTEGLRGAAMDEKMARYGLKIRLMPGSLMTWQIFLNSPPERINAVKAEKIYNYGRFESIRRTARWADCKRS